MPVCWEGKIKPGVSRAVVSQVDFLATFAALTNQPLLLSQAIDSYNMLSTLQGLNKKGHDQVVLLSLNNTRSIVKGEWKFIPLAKGPKVMEETKIKPAKIRISTLLSKHDIENNGIWRRNT